MLPFCFWRLYPWHLLCKSLLCESAGRRFSLLLCVCQSKIETMRMQELAMATWALVPALWDLKSAA